MIGMHIDFLTEMLTKVTSGGGTCNLMFMYAYKSKIPGLGAAVTFPRTLIESCDVAVRRYPDWNPGLAVRPNMLRIADQCLL